MTKYKGFKNQALNMMYCMETQNQNAALDYARETYALISKPEIFGSGKRLIGQDNYEAFMEYKHHVVGIALRDKYGEEVGPNRFTMLEQRMEAAKPKFDRNTIDSFLGGRK